MLILGAIICASPVFCFSCCSVVTRTTVGTAVCSTVIGTTLLLTRIGTTVRPLIPHTHECVNGLSSLPLGKN